MSEDLVAFAKVWLVNAGYAALIVLVGYFAISPIKKAVGKALEKGMKKRPLLVNLATQTTEKVLWVIVAVMALSRLGVDVGPIIAGLGVTGFILGFAFQESLGNLASGLMLAINEPFKAGDFVEVAGHSGTVREVSIMATELSTPDNKKVVIPNKSVWGGPITNYSALGQRRVDLTVGIAYGENIERAVKIAREAVMAVPGVLEEPAPRVEPVSFDDSAITICLRPWVATADYWSVHASVIKNVKAAFDKAGVTIPFPQIDVHNV
ncbi:MAG: mechanosensitive ion channel family protein [Kiritimatiellae bacterium]|nr:mechanosensitive ion channel family protein [Kiritimatiellia bacterium]